jgi:RNA polymerase sigma-70 factor (ECF subfamily)
MVGCPEDAADLTQETFVRAYEKLEQFRLSSRFFPWLYTIGMNLARDYLRKKKRAPETLSLSAMDGCILASVNGRQQEKFLLDQLNVQHIAGLIAGLPFDYREALILRFQMGLSMQEIGSALGITVSGAKMRVKRGLEQLRALVQDPEEALQSP